VVPQPVVMGWTASPAGAPAGRGRRDCGLASGSGRAVSLM
jgi:hypothetical protein